jgi:hypothetical protein
MPACPDRFLRILIVPLLGIALASCGPGKPTDDAFGARPTTAIPPDTVTPDSTPRPMPASPLPSSAPSAPPASASPADAAGSAAPEADALGAALSESKPAPSDETAFSAKRSSLNGISLGTPMGTVESVHGRPVARYTLPDGNRQVEMAEYPGFTVGYFNDRTVYVEVYTSDVSTGIRGLTVGQSADDAAQALGLESADLSSNVLTVRVDGGLLKADLDPESRKVVSVRLIGEN